MFNDYLQYNNGNINNANLSGKAKIRVIGVGGAGNNAVNRMLDAGITSAEYIVVNTDSQILALSPCERKIQIGVKLTSGLGAGADPEVGRAAAEESKDELTEAIKGTDLLFITAGMGGGTGTGAAPVIAKIARDLKILTIAVVTEPFSFEGKKRMENTVKGLDNLKKYVDTLIVIPNDKIKTVVPKNTPMAEALRVADEILKQGIKGLTELIVNPSLINLDFADVKTILKDSGIAHLGVGVAKGDNRILEAVRVAINCPLLETTIEGARGVILNVVGGNDLTYYEVEDAAELVRGCVDASANIIFGARIDPNVQDEVEITVIATGFPGFDTRNRDDQARSPFLPAQPQPKLQQLYDDGIPPRRMSVAEPYYKPQAYQQPAPQVPPVQPVQPVQQIQQIPPRQYPQEYYQQPVQQVPPMQQPVQQLPPQQVVRPVDDGNSIERPNDKDVPKFARLLKNFGKRRDQ